ncbi:MAG: hypothetical protein ABID64_03645 [Nitrospirota bacterium]
MENTQNKYKNLKEKLSQLYFLTEEEIEEILVRAKGIKEEGLDELIKLFDEGKTKQDDVLVKLIEKDKSFVENLKKTLRKMYSDTTDEVTKQESESAEELLKDL